MIKLIKRVFVPSRFDACCMVVALHWLTAILSVTVLPALPTIGAAGFSGPVILFAGSTLLAIAATVVWKANSRRRTWLLLVSAIASTCFVIAWFFFNEEYARELAYRPNVAAMNQAPAFTFSGFMANAAQSLGMAWACAIGAFVLTWCARFLGKSVLRPFRWFKTKFQSDRTRLLVGVAGVMFVLAVLSRLIQLTESGGRRDTSFMAVEVAFQLLVIGIVGTIAIVWFPRSFVLSGKPIQKAFSILVILGMAMPGIANLISGVFVFDGAIFVLAGLVYVLSVIGVGGCGPANDSEAASRATPGLAGSWPSAWSFVPLILLIAAIAVPTVLDLQVISGTNRKLSVAELFQRARESAIVKWESAGRVQLRTEQSYNLELWQVQFDDSAPRDLLNVVQKISSSRSVELCDLTPEFDISVLNGSGIGVALKDCEVSNAQLTDILSSSSWLSIEGRFEIVDDGTEVDAGVINSVNFQNVEPGAIRTFFAAAKCEQQMTYMIIHSPATNEDWSTIEEVGQTGYVFLCGGWAEDFEMPEVTRSLNRITFQKIVNNTGQPKPVDKRLILETDLRLGLRMPANSSKLAWKLLMLRGDSSGFDFQYAFAESGKSLSEYAKDIGMAWQENEDQSVRSLFFPWGSSVIETASMPELRSLSFDADWVGAMSPFGFRGDPVDVSHLEPLSSLEELYFEASFVPLNLAFLEKLTSLKHLQISSVVRKVTGPIGFDACPSLESLTFLGTPDNKSYHEISRLKNLERLVIVNVEDDEKLTPEYQDKLQQKLSGVEVQIIPASEKASLIPNAFQEHRESVRKKLLYDTTWLDEIKGVK
ncbi:hypothetical protein [Mariniblastus fucicola]|nr:hypothetical protein [Mariniblastus fucicola]